MKMESHYISDEIERIESTIERKQNFINTVQREIDLLVIQKSALIDALEKTA